MILYSVVAIHLLESLIAGIAQTEESDMTMVQEIQVSGLDCFPANEWKRAILHYLFGMWKGDESVTYRPKITISQSNTSEVFSLRLDPTTAQYYTEGDYTDIDPPHYIYCYPPCIPTLTIGCNQDEVEQGLIRFVKNEKIQVLIIWDNPRRVCFWKTREGKSTRLNVAVRK